MFLSTISSNKSIYQYDKIIIDFEYMNNIYSTIAQPYNTLYELRENIIKKIFPKPKNIHCYYHNIDINNKEDEQIATLFPLRKKVKIQLRQPSKEKNMTKPYISYKCLETKSKSIITEAKNVYPKIDNTDSINIKNNNSNIKLKIKINKKNKNNNNNINIIKKRLLLFSNFLDNQKDKRKSQEILESIGNDFNDYLENDELFYYLHKNKIKKFRMEDDNNENNENDNNSIKLEKKPNKKLKQLSLNLKDIKKRNNNQNFNNNRKNCMTQRGEEVKLNRIKIENGEKNENETSFEQKDDDNSVRGKKNIITMNKNKNVDNDNNNNKINDNNNNNKDNDIKNIEDACYICPKCGKNIITNWCLNCNKFACHDCLAKCKLEKHENIKIDVNNDCLYNVKVYASLIISDIEKKINDVQEYNKELKIYDIKKKRDNLVLMFNEILNLYSKITKILNNIYKEKDVKISMSKYKLDSDKIKEEINEIIHKAESYLKNDENNCTPKYKIMNIQYFFNLINEKNNNHKIITDNMNVYSLNANINSNIEKSLNEIEEIMKKLSNKENDFELKGSLKKEYDKIIKDNEAAINMNKEKKKLFRRKSVVINLNKNNFLIPGILTQDNNKNEKK